MPFRVWLEIIRAVAVLIVLIILIKKGKPIAAARREGYLMIMIGYGLIVFASLLDITDNFPSLDKYVIIGDTPIQAILEKVVGYLLGFILMAIGFWRWLPRVSELQKAQEQLKKSLQRQTDLRHKIQNERNRLFTTLYSIGDGVISTDTQGLIVLINPAAEKLTGWTQVEAAGKPIEKVFNIINEKTKKAVETPIRKVLESGQIIGLANHTELISKQGKSCSIADSGAPVKDINGEIIGVVLVFRDVTREREITAEKLKNQKLESIGILAGGIAHDFNNLLLGIQGNISLAMLSEKIDGKILDFLTDADKAAKRAGMLTQQLLTFSKGGNPNIKNISISESVQESANFVLTGSDIKCHFKIDDNLCLARIDKRQIGQVIQNIIINSRQAMTEGGIIEITIANLSEKEAEKLNSDEKKYIHIKIEDSGSGIAEENIDKIFDPYFSTKQDGSGLGLSTSFSIIKKHHGFIKVNSTYGEGTTFSIYLPAVEKKASHHKPKPEKSQPQDKADAKVLIMDDEPFIRKILSSMLKKIGYKVILAADGQETLEIYRNSIKTGEKIDVVMLDLTIAGGMGGEETAQELLKIDKDVKMIVISGYSDNPILSQYRDFGFAGAITKPFKTDLLSNVIQEVITCEKSF